MSGKRKREEDGERATIDLDLYSGKELILTASAMLCVPTALLFRHVQGQVNPLLSRSEAQTFLQIRMLSQELDTWVDLTREILQEPPLLDVLKEQEDAPYLRPLRVVLESNDTTPQMNEIAQRVQTTIQELAECRKVLRHSAEQNWSVAQLLQSTAIGEEKQMLSEIQDELCRRIHLLSSVPIATPVESTDPMVSMDEYCQNLLGPQKEEVRAAASIPSPVMASPSTADGTPARRDDVTTPLKTSQPPAKPTPPSHREKSPATQQKGTGMAIKTPERQVVPQKATAATSELPRTSRIDHLSSGTQEASTPTNNNVAHTPVEAKKASVREPTTTPMTKEPITQKQTLSLDTSDDDDDEILEHMVQQDSAMKARAMDHDTISQDLTSPAVSPKQDSVVEKENEPSQASTHSSSSSIQEDAAFRSQHAAEVLSTIRRMT